MYYKQIRDSYKIDYIVDENKRYYLTREWQVIAHEMKLSEDDIQLLRMHFDGNNSLYYELRELKNGFNTKVMKLDKGRAWIAKGRLETRNRSMKPYAVIKKERSKTDKHSNIYLVVGQNHYVHKVTAQLVYNELGKSLDGMEIHHRLMDKTLTKKANMIPYLVVMRPSDHKRLHKLLHDMRLFEFDKVSEAQKPQFEQLELDI